MKVSSIYLYSTHCYCSVTCLCGARTTNLSLLWVRCDWKENFSPYNVTLAFLSIHHTTRWPLFHTTLCHINLISQPYTKCHCTIYLYFAICCPEAEDRGKNRTKIISVSFNRNHKTFRPFYIPKFVESKSNDKELRQKFSQHQLDNAFNRVPMAIPQFGIVGSTPPDNVVGQGQAPLFMKQRRTNMSPMACAQFDQMVP